MYGAPQVVIDAVQGAKFSVYPDPAQVDLRTEIAKYHGMDLMNVVAGAGSDDILDIMIRIIDTKVVISSSPTFGMYR